MVGVPAAVEVAGCSALWIRGGCRQDYKQQVMSSEHVRPAPFLEGYVNVIVDKICSSALSTLPFFMSPCGNAR